MAEVLQPTEQNIERAAAVLRAGGVVAMPTETVYGLAGRTLDAGAIARIYELKGRPANNPLIAHVLGAEGARRITAAWPAEADTLASAFWPGPLTMVLPRAAHVPTAATGGRDTLAVRAPRHPVARALLACLGGEPLSAPSANMSGRTSATRAEHVARDFAHVDGLLVLDGGACDVGIESTVVRLAGGRAAVLRPGSVTAVQIAGALGLAVRAVEAVEALEQGDAPGTALRHYAPATPARLVAHGSLAGELARMNMRCAVLAAGPESAAALPAAAAARHVVFAMPAGCDAYAAALYDSLRRADAAGCECMVIEEPSTEIDGPWAAVRDRLRRATSA